MLLRQLLMFVLLLLCTICTKLAAQNTVKGKWYGVGNVEITNVTSSYLCELILDQKGTLVTGEFNYYFRNGYFSNKVKGKYNPTTRTLTLQFFPVIYHKSVNTAMGVDCMMEGSFNMRISKVDQQLVGRLTADETHAYTCPSIAIRFKKQFKETTLEAVKASVETDTVAIPTAPITASKLPNDTPDVAEAERPEVVATLKPPAASSIVVPNEAQLKQKSAVEFITRTKVFIKELDVVDDSVTVELYDNGEYDKDSISLFYNNKMVVFKQELNTKTPIVVKLPVSNMVSMNELSMLAENLGLIPPNAAVMIIRDSRNRYEVNLTSNLERNATILLRKVPKK
ncbi:MAG: hypothetical protein ACK4HE_00945 [Chitinophagaceae bacterium]